ncbi:MAG: ABC transporter permease [Candidatus Dormibacteraceae bacterium]
MKTSDRAPADSSAAGQGTRRFWVWRLPTSRAELVGIAARVFSVHALLIVTIVLVVVFAILLPDTFLTPLTARAIIYDKSTVALLALGEMVVIASGHFDLSVGYGVGTTYILVIVLQVHQHLSWEAAVVCTVLAGAGIGVMNGVLVHYIRIDSFIATLGSGSVLYGFSQWYTNGAQIVGFGLPDAFKSLNGAIIAGIPVPLIYVLVVAVMIWIAFEFLPIGRYLYALGSNPKAAELTGIPRGRYVIGAFVVSGILVGIAGVLLGSELQVAQSSVGADYLLPAFVGPLLGSTTIRPGRVNVWGTIVAVLVLAVGIAGIQQMGGAFFAEPLFNGITLLVAVGLAGYAARRSVRAQARRGEAARRIEQLAKSKEQSENVG